MQQFTSLIGIGLLLGIALLLSDNRRHISARIIGVSLGLQFLVVF
jgi:nucleoside permease NupC